MLKKIALEVHNKCTRKCWFCPGSLSDNINSDKNGNFRYMDKELVTIICDKILDDKNMIKDELLILLYGFSELTFHSDVLVDIIKTLHIKLDGKIKFYTKLIVNGDLISKKFMDDIIGINYLSINDYDGIGINRFFDIINKCDINILHIKTHMEKIHYNKRNIEVFDKNRNIIIRYCINTNDINAFNLGSCIFREYKYTREKRCELLGQELMIDANGVVKICTNVNQDLPIHKDVCKWNINYSSIREILKDINKLNIPQACLHCDNRWWDCI